MDEQAKVRRVLAVQITVGAARSLFPGVSRSELYAAAPHDGQARRLTLGRAFEIAHAQFETEARQAQAARAAEARATDLAVRQAAAALPALDHLATVISTQNHGLLHSLHLRGASERAIRIIARIGAVNGRHAGRARTRLRRGIERAFK